MIATIQSLCKLFCVTGFCAKDFIFYFLAAAIALQSSGGAVPATELIKRWLDVWMQVT